MPKYKVELRRIRHDYTTVEVDADSSEAASTVARKFVSEHEAELVWRKETYRPDQLFLVSTDLQK